MRELDRESGLSRGRITDMSGDGTEHSALQRMVAPPAPQAGTGDGTGAATPTRALRIALTRAAESAAGLSVTALGAADETLALSDLLARLADDWLLIGLDSANGPGVCALDPALFLAVVEMQTRGGLALAEPAHRLPTLADAALAEPVLCSFIAELPALAAGTALDGWPGACTPGPRQADRRALGLILPECAFRVVSVSCWLGVGERQGNFLMALPALSPSDPHDDRAARRRQWGQALSLRVLAAPLGLEAVLHRLRMPLASLGELAPGRKVALPGVRLAGVELVSRDGTHVAHGRLGQSGGMRAIRIGPVPAPELSPELSPEPPPEPLPEPLPGSAPPPAVLDAPDLP